MGEAVIIMLTAEGQRVGSTLAEPPDPDSALCSLEAAAIMQAASAALVSAAARRAEALVVSVSILDGGLSIERMVCSCAFACKKRSWCRITLKASPTYIKTSCKRSELSCIQLHQCDSLLCTISVRLLDIVQRDGNAILG